MVLWVGRVNKGIIREHQDELVQVLTKKIVYHIHELGRGIGDAKRHNQEFIKPPPRLKSCFVNVFWFYRFLVQPTVINTKLKAPILLGYKQD